MTTRNTAMKAVAIFDRDNTLIEDSGYMHGNDQILLIQESLKLAKALSSRGFKLAIATNQSGIARGLFTVQDMHLFHHRLLAQLKCYNLNIDGLEYCPHHPDDHCRCRKPMPGMIYSLCCKLNVAPNDCVFIGDKNSDIECGQAHCRAGIYFSKGSRWQAAYNQIVSLYSLRSCS